SAHDRVIHHRVWTDRAGTDAIDALQCDAAIRRRLAGADAERMLERAQQPAAVIGDASFTDADPDHVTSGLPGPDTGVERANAGDLGRRRAHIMRDPSNGVGRDEAVSILNGEKGL